MDKQYSRYGLAYDNTGYIANWTWNTFNFFPMKMDLVFGIIDNQQNNSLVGSAMFSDFNGHNVELNWYGKGLTIKIAKALALIAAKHFNVVRGTIREPEHNLSLIRRLKKLGFMEEGIEQHYYGWNKHCVRLVIFRPQIDKLAGIQQTVH